MAEGIKPNYCLIKLDERQFWNEEISGQTKAMYGVYAFDRNERTFCCEITPSYCLVFVANDYEEIDDLSEEERDSLNEKVLSASNEPVTYMHVRTVEKIIADHPERFRSLDVEIETDESDDENQAWNRIRRRRNQLQRYCASVRTTSRLVERK